MSITDNHELTMDQSEKNITDVLEGNRDKFMAIQGIHGIAIGKAVDHGGEDGPCIVIYIDDSADLNLIPIHIAEFPIYTSKTEGFTAL